MTILGISASGREKGITAQAVKYVLETSGEKYEYISLARLVMNGCRGCTLCAKDNRCVMKDDWIDVAEKMLSADAIVFGAANYYGMVNSLAHACLERTFAFRHREVFSLAGKLGVAIGTGGGTQDTVVVDYIQKLMVNNKMALIGTACIEGYLQCYTCGYGEDCAAGGVVGKHGFCDAITEEMLPKPFAERSDDLLQLKKVGKTLGSVLRGRR